jgi:hypothetical protein
LTLPPLERILREVRRRTRVVGAFPNGNIAQILGTTAFVTSAVRAGERVVISAWIYSKRWEKKKSLPEP